MTAGLTLRDPTAETSGALRPPVPAPASLDGLTVALLDIGKMRGDEFIDRLEALLAARGIATRRFRKPTNTRTAPDTLLQDIATTAGAVVIALSDCGSCTSCSTHDLNDLDRRGIPGVNVITEAFVSPFADQCAAIGFAGASVVVPHPVQNRTTAELHAMAEAAVPAVLAALGVAATE
ncbi:MAG: hypothetical protein MUC89_00775 [Acetobacteraceae bacterium]|jgi:hypothetical protein|nr:hypothetical protein [Acetobacteraceae bacterium]